jgi:ACS family pantothenate transporter-like MFS transporter
MHDAMSFNNKSSDPSGGEQIHSHDIEVNTSSRNPADAAPPTNQRRSFRSFIWDTDTHLKTPEEQRLLLKLDAAILSIGCLGLFMKYLDQGNMANAYVSDVQEKLNMYGNEYTYAGSVYTVAYAVLQILSTLIIQRVRPSLWLAIMEVCWGVFTFAQADMHSTGQLYAFRFLVGFFESSFFTSLL